MTIHYDMPMAEYLKHPALNSSKLKLMLKTALDFKEGLEAANEDTKNTILGTAVHTLLLEPETFNSRYVLQMEDFGDKRSGDGKKRWADFKKEHSGKVILGQEEANFLHKLKAKASRNPSLKLLIASGKPEVTGFIETDDIALKARADLLLEDAIWDVKTTAGGVDDNSLYRTIKKYRYDFQAAHYIHVFNTLSFEGSIRSFGWIFVDTASPAQHIRLIKAPLVMLNNAFNDHFNVLESIANCKRDSHWDGYSQELAELELPPWAEELK